MKRPLALLVSALVLSCFDGPVAGEVTLSLTTPNTDDGAVSFTVTVPAPNEVTGATATCDGCEVFATRVSATELRGIVTGDLPAGPVVRGDNLRFTDDESFRDLPRASLALTRIPERNPVDRTEDEEDGQLGISLRELPGRDALSDHPPQPSFVLVPLFDDAMVELWMEHLFV